MERNCKKCGSNIPNYAKVNGKVRVLSSRVYCLVCSPFGARNTRALDTLLSLDEQRQSRLLNRRAASVIRVQNSRKELTKRAIEYKGGKCVTCGYNKCYRALHFHHVDAKDKEFSIRGWKRIMSWDKIQAELDKCVLLCSNCHMEVEAGITLLPTQLGVYLNSRETL